MTATGLLIDHQARECIAAGYAGPWLAYFADGSVHPAKTATGPITIGDEDISVDAWLVGADAYRDGADPETIESLERDSGLLGFSPPPGFWLPFSTAPRRMVIMALFYGTERTIRRDDDKSGWSILPLVGGPNSAESFPDGDFEGWQPIVRVSR